MIYDKLTQLIGNTPLLRIPQEEDWKAGILLKLESFNPGGSSKDRIALAMIEDAEQKGLLKAEGTIIEPTSGNTGVGLAWVAAAKGYRVILTMPDTMSIERRTIVRALGAEVVLTPGSEGMKGAIRKAEELKESIPGSIIPGQFTNPANPKAHEMTTGEEIWRDTGGHVDIFIAAAGTGGTVTGTSRALKKHDPGIRTVAVEPASSAVLSGGAPGRHRIQGIGAGFIPEIYDAEVIDEVFTVSDDDAIYAARMLASRYGLLAGISSGAAFHAAMTIAKRDGNEGRTIVALIPDTGERYLSTELYAFEDYPINR